MRAPLRPLAPALLLALALGCVKPAGSCTQTSECAANETCDGGVCVRVPNPGGGGTGGGTVPGSYTPVTWSKLQGVQRATFQADSIGADPTTGDVVVAGALSGADYSPWGLSTGAFVARLAGADGTLSATFPPVPFPTFAHGQFRAAVRADGLVLFAATAFAPTTLGALPTIVPPPQGSLVVGLLDALGDPVWAVTVDSTSAATTLVPVAVSARGTDLLVAGTGAGDFGCPTGPTAAATFVALLSGVDGTCVWSRGLATRSVADVEPRDLGDVATGGICAPTGAFFDPQGGTTCASGLWVAALSGADGSTVWATTGSGIVSAVRDLAVSPDGTVTAVGDATGKVSFGGPTVDFGSFTGSFAVAFGPTGTPGAPVRPIEAPYAPKPDAASFVRCAADRLGRVWIAGRYEGQPTLLDTLFPACRPPACAAATFLARLDGNGKVGSFLPLPIAPTTDGQAYADDLVLCATTGTLAHALQLTGSTTVGGAAWSSAGAGDLGVIRIKP
jgi:hypothetical protein